MVQRASAIAWMASINSSWSDFDALLKGRLLVPARAASASLIQLPSYLDDLFQFADVATDGAARLLVGVVFAYPREHIAVGASDVGQGQQTERPRRTPPASLHSTVRAARVALPGPEASDHQRR